MFVEQQLAQLNNPGDATLLRYHCGIRVYSMTMSDTCATHVLDKGKSESCLVKAPAKAAGGR